MNLEFPLAHLRNPEVLENFDEYIAYLFNQCTHPSAESLMPKMEKRHISLYQELLAVAPSARSITLTAKGKIGDSLKKKIQSPVVTH
jgi:hypothetical protein